MAELWLNQENFVYFCVSCIRQKCTDLYISALILISVTPEGLEPPTDRTGICYSIQLNYGANCSQN